MRRRTRLIIALTALWWVRFGGGGVAAAPFPDDCNDVCSSTTSCQATCFPDEIAFENGNRISCLTWGVYATPCCGDGSCDSGEDFNSCFGDCHCGDHTCDAGENVSTCPADCGGGPPPPECSGTCTDETCDDCPEDCWHDSGVCGYCGDGICEADETGGYGTPYAGHCDTADGWCSYCGEDCDGGCVPTACWPYVCDPDETECTNCDDDDDCKAAYSEAFCSAYDVCMLSCSSNDDCRPTDHCVDSTCIPIG